jgi:hypothetical protein
MYFVRRDLVPPTPPLYVYHRFKVQPDDGPLKRPKYIVAVLYILRYIYYTVTTPHRLIDVY